ncbi:MAG TPA: hypothetical protein VJ783_01625 [Pirellulales bacterium]|nr:hypothetical protein [Pirellulales bacterium]
MPGPLWRGIIPASRRSVVAGGICHASYLHFDITDLDTRGWIAAVVAYPCLPERLPTLDWFGPAQASVFGQPQLDIFAVTFAKAWLFSIPSSSLALQALYWFILPRNSATGFVQLLLTGLIGYLQCAWMWSTYNGWFDQSHSIVAVAWFGIVILSGIAARIYHERKDSRRGQPATALTNERFWIDDHRISAWLLAVAALVTFVFCMATGNAFLFIASLATAVVIAVTPAQRPQIRDSRAPESP